MFGDDTDADDMGGEVNDGGPAVVGPVKMGGSGWQAGDFQNGLGLLGMVPPGGPGFSQKQNQSAVSDQVPGIGVTDGLTPVAGRRGKGATDAHARACQRLYEQDVDQCNQLAKPRDRAICQASAAQRYSNCLAGRPLGPLTLPSAPVPVVPLPRGTPPLGLDPFLPPMEPFIPDGFLPVDDEYRLTEQNMNI